ncbi:MAG TPA: hypothetical protein DEP84_09310, partial [Chloroflexi bacterium]|nr:hypothetical protein [Chloroflexota bacterium]
MRPGGRFLLVDSVAPSDPELAAFLNQLETRRDLTHQRTLPADTWLAMFYAAGLPPLGYEYFPRHHDLDDWLARAQTPPPAQAEVRAML